jgi:phage-related protein
MAVMIYFNGVSIMNAADVMIEDIRVSPIQLTAVARQRAIAFGADFVRMRGGSRTVTITFGLLDENMDSRQTKIRKIIQWARSEQPGRLILPHYNNMYLECICTALPEPSMRQWWESRLSLTFTTYDNPFFNSIQENSAECGADFIVKGDAPPLMRIENTLYAAASHQAYSDGENTMTFSTIPRGKLVIDLNQQTATVGTESIMQHYEFGSSFLIPKTGANNISGNGVVKWRERWE